MARHCGFLTFLAFMFLASAGCRKSPDNEQVSSHNGETKSHHQGADCSGCHKSGGSASEYIWVACGTVYKNDSVTPNPNGVINFWTGQMGTGNLIATLEVDGNGNFFTNSAILPGAGCYPQARSASGNLQNMLILNVSGSCNLCHSSNSNRIRVE
jgi:Fe-S cluster biogenesis protein NfuA